MSFSLVSAIAVILSLLSSPFASLFCISGGESSGVVFAGEGGGRARLREEEEGCLLFPPSPPLTHVPTSLLSLFPAFPLLKLASRTRERVGKASLSGLGGHSESLALGLGWPARPLFLPLPPNSVLASSKASSETQREAKEEEGGGVKELTPLFFRGGAEVEDRGDSLPPFSPTVFSSPRSYCFSIDKRLFTERRRRDKKLFLLGQKRRRKEGLFTQVRTGPTCRKRKKETVTLPLLYGISPLFRL